MIGRRAPKVLGQQVSTEVVRVYGPDDVSVGMVRDLNRYADLGLSGHSGSVRWDEGAGGFEGYIAKMQQFRGAAAGGMPYVSGDAGLPDTSAPAQFMSPMQALLGQMGR